MTSDMPSTDTHLDPPDDEPERYLPVGSAPFAAIVRAVIDWLGEAEYAPGTMRKTAEEQRGVVMQAMGDALRATGLSDVDVTEEEWEAHCEGERDRDPRI